MAWRSYYNETELTPLLRLEDFSLECEEEDGFSLGVQSFVSSKICFQNTTSPKAKEVCLQDILKSCQVDDYLVSPHILKNVEVKGRFGCCGMLGDLEENSSYNVFCVNGHAIGIETSECIVDVHYTRIPAENVDVLEFEK